MSATFDNLTSEEVVELLNEFNDEVDWEFPTITAMRLLIRLIKHGDDYHDLLPKLRELKAQNRCGMEYALALP